MQARWEQATREASEWGRARRRRRPRRARRSRSEGGAHATAAMERAILNARDYKLAEEAGYQMHTIIQLAPSRPNIHVVREVPQTVDRGSRRNDPE